uniref:Uncharacterized protein n=1 Tax=Scophthalmus maximus TaxID=52904 RepID=A0A8D3B871_SCOMX
MPLSSQSSLKAFHTLTCLRFRCGSSLLYPKVVGRLTETRTMTEEEVLQIQDTQPDAISPLILEVVSKDSCNDF